MPYEKILVTHKFGIISQSHKKELLERLRQRRQKIEDDIARKYEKKDESIDLQINEDFVKAYNEASFDKKSKLNAHCVRILEKLKKKLINSDTIDDLSIQLCWAELSQLMQCTSPIQEECMDLFIYSLESAKLSAMHIPTLFFLAETIIYWIRTDTIHQPLLRAYEIKLLKVGHLVFQRIYYHHFERTLDHESSLKEHLNVYLTGFDELIEAYSPYPDACFYVSSMINVGNLLLAPNPAESNSIATNLNQSNSSQIEFNSLLLKSSIRLFAALRDAKSKRNELDVESLMGDVFDSSIRLSSSSSSSQKQQHEWIESSLAFHILGECAKQNARCLDEFIRLSGSKQLHSETSFASKSLASGHKFGLESWSWELGCVYVEVLADIVIHSNNPAIKRRALLGFAKDAHEILKSSSLLVNSSAGYGLIEASKFQLGVGSYLTNSSDDWKWKIRYQAIKELVRICKVLTSKENEELRQTCWCSLIILQESETNKYVLEAIKVGQVNSKLEKTAFGSDSSRTLNSVTRIRLADHKVNFYTRFATKLLELANTGDALVENNEENGTGRTLHQRLNSATYLEDKTLRFEDIPYGDLQNLDSHPTTAAAANRRSHKQSGNNKSHAKNDDVVSNGQFSKKRTTLRDEIIISDQFRMRVPNYYERKNFDLMRIVEDQYRKELEEKIEQRQKEKRQNAKTIDQ